ERVFVDVPGIRLVQVGAADEAELPRVDAPVAVEAEAVFQDFADEVATWVLADRHDDGVRPLVRPEALLERAQLVRRAAAHPREAVEAALRARLQLEQLDERLDRLPAERVFGAERILELHALAEVRVVRDDERVAAGAGVQAVVFDRLPHALRRAVGPR